MRTRDATHLQPLSVIRGYNMFAIWANWAIVIRLGGLGVGWPSPPTREATAALVHRLCVQHAIFGVFLLSLCVCALARIYPPHTRPIAGRSAASCKHVQLTQPPPAWLAAGAANAGWRGLSPPLPMFTPPMVKVNPDG